MGVKNIEDFYPLSPMQQGILFHSLAAPKSGVYFEQFSCSLTGKLDIVAFESAWQQVVDRHPILRTSFAWEGLKEPVQVVHRQVKLSSVQHDWRHLSFIEQQQQLEAFLQSDRSQSFVFTLPPLMRLMLIQLSDNSYHFTWSQHHLLLDGWSVAIIFQEVFTFYDALSKSQDAYVAPSRPYRDYIVWQQQQNLSEAETFWRQMLKGFTAPTKLWLDQNQQRLPNDSYAQQQIQLEAATTAALQSLVQKHQLTLNTLVQAAWALLLSRYSGEEDVVFGAIVSGRPSALPKAESMVGLFINTLPVRVKVDPEAFLLPWLKQIQAQQVEARQYEYTPLVEIHGWSEVPRGVSLFESIVVFENYPIDAALRKRRADLEIKDFHGFQRTNYPLTLTVLPGSELLLALAYDESKNFNAATINRMLWHLKTLLANIAANCDRQLWQYSLLTKAERHQLLVEWNDTQAEYPQDQCIQQLFEVQVERTPDAVAVVFEDQQLTYRELNQRANQLAHHLRSLGVKPEVLVGICTQRSLDMVVGILGILKAGGAYLPLDPSYPKERLTLILEDANLLVLLTQRQLITELPKHKAQIVCLDAEWEEIAQGCTQQFGFYSEENCHSSLTLENLAYVIYTSGSTGIPKGVMVTHRALVNHSISVAKAYQLQKDDCVLQFASISFDVAAEEVFPSLLTGATVIIRPDWILDFTSFHQFLEQEKLTVLNLPTAYWHEWVSYLTQKSALLPTALRLVIVGTEPALPEKLALWQEFAGDRILWLNAYGPTEATIGTTIYQPDTSQENQQISWVPIGRPIANTQVYLLDRHLNPVPVGVLGEIYIGGVSLARGYLNRPELTALQFIPNPFGESGASLYKTGDLACYLPNGDIQFIGRIDQQVKIRGFRIELGEIEAELLQHPQVCEAVVILGDSDRTNKYLVAYVTLQSGQTLTVTELRSFLKEKLPQYMVPSAFLVLTALPLLPNGKIDRRSLPTPQTLRPEMEVAYVMPRTEAEQAIATVWQKALALEKIGIQDNFFELGGHSLLIVKIHSQLREIFKTDLLLLDLFRYPTISSLAEYFSRAKNQTSSQEIDIKTDTIAVGKSHQKKRLQKIKSININEGFNK